MSRTDSPQVTQALAIGRVRTAPRVQPALPDQTMAAAAIAALKPGSVQKAEAPSANAYTLKRNNATPRVTTTTHRNTLIWTSKSPCPHRRYNCRTCKNTITISYVYDNWAVS